jgi:hypothetical protein
MQDAVVMLLDLPRFWSEKIWHADVIANVAYDREPDFDRQYVADYARRDGNFGNLWTLGLAHTAVAYHFDRWMIYPSEYHNEDYLDFTVILNPLLWQEGDESEKDSGYLIVVDYDEVKDWQCSVWGNQDHLKDTTVEEFIESVNQTANAEAQINPHWSSEDGTLKGIFVPYYQRCLDETLRVAKEKMRLVIAEKAGEGDGSVDQN